MQMVQKSNTVVGLDMWGTTQLTAEYDTTLYCKMENCNGESVENQTDMTHVY